MAPSKDIYLVIGGSGFVGRHIVQQLLDRGDTVSVFDIVQRYHDVPFYSGDISDESQVADALRKSGTTCIIHTASPPAGLNNAALYFKVNVDGTKAVIAAAVATGVRKLVFTSSAGVVFNGGDIIDVDERLPPPQVPMDAYNESKAQAEAAVLAANGKGGLLTVALRPAGIFGPGDRQVMTGLYQVYERGQTHFQIGDNTNLFDWTYVGNVARAHLLAADRLDTPPPAPPLSEFEFLPATVDAVPPLTDAEERLINYPLPTISVSTGTYRVPTCKARPLGPYVTPVFNAEKIEAAFNDPNPPISNRPITRTRFDPLSEHALTYLKLQKPETSPLQVAGQVFFITNGEPCYFWDFPRAVWHQLDAHFPDHRKPRGLIKLPKAIGMAAATGSEWAGWLTGKEPTFTRFKVTFSCATRWHNIEKARRVLGYEPLVGVEEGVKRMVEWWFEEYSRGNHKVAH
ncbi:Sterol-4-alpha-carboxylate 3-dehydrogenase, decarboxylating [Hypsizygus marmoreus]|uniref:Sterol-4-alpha-carboxylate 3-dehydrogenase, decarboxylating n=1 Tax=Hypsizygus marmoreus TaxID=39966 RepID=A0A369JGJ2_HYPMA|nr:Sterol-4-alpha-carboxylate 3-dehydrogenase, decarboxylating [Hypsizygus marmoreus]